VSRHIALLRAVNVGGRKLLMSELREAAAAIGWRQLETYIQSGNLLFAADGAPETLEPALEAALRDRFGMDVPVMIRTANAWRALLEANPLPDAAREAPSRLLIGVPKGPLRDGAAEALQDRASHGEIVRAAGGALWFHYAGGVGTSKLTPALIDRLAGSPVTARNWNTAAKLRDMASG
jgi:uncharacterized protein (DUF1697 family)